MTNRSLFIHKVLLVICLVGYILVAPACAPPPVGASSQIPPTCVPPSLNPYNMQDPQNVYVTPNMATYIFSSYKNNPATYDSARQVAFSQLGKNIMQRSYYRDVMIDDESMVRISITYLDPMLVQYVVLNYALASPNHLMGQDWFIGQIQKSMDSLAKRNEIMFIVSVTASDHANTLKVNFPINDLHLRNASKLEVLPTHNDPILNEEIDVSKESIFGYVGYPLALSLQDCTGIMDIWTTSVTLDLKSTPQENIPYHNLYWEIYYQPLIVLRNDSQATPIADLFYDPNRFTGVAAPPTPNWNPASQVDDAHSPRYWEDMGRYIWNKLLMENSR